MSPVPDRVCLGELSSPLGTLLAGACADGIVLLEFSEPARLERQLAGLRRQFGMACEQRGHPHLQVLQRQLDEYFAGTRRDFELPLRYPGSPFQDRVWALLRDIPYGQTRSYEQLAEHLGDPRACRAVGTANGANRLAILVPCHRVINKSGALGGYGGGLWRKRFLLDLESGTRALL